MTEQVETINFKRHVAWMPVSNEMLMDFGEIPDTRHYPPRFPGIVIWSWWDREAARIRGWRDTWRYMRECWTERDNRHNESSAA